MKKKDNSIKHADSSSMLAQKTNEDFNKKKPDPTDPNESKNKPDTVIPDNGAGGQATIKTPVPSKKGHKTDGSE